MSEEFQRSQHPTVAMILAAGFGTRMAPLSRAIPKALLPILGRPLLEWVLRHLATQGVTRTVVNVHHLPQPVIDWSARHASSRFTIEAQSSFIERSGSSRKGRSLGASSGESPSKEGSSVGGSSVFTLPRIQVIHEPVILGTGGGIANAAALLTSDPVLIHNVDLLLRFDLDALLRAHQAGDFAATLALVRDPEHAQIATSGARITGIESRPDPSAWDLWCFSGVSVLSQAAIAEFPKTGFAELTPHLRRWAREGRLGAHFEPSPFLEVGTIESYLEASRELASSETLDCYVAGSPGELLRPGPESIFAPDSEIGERATVTASIGLPGAIVPSGARLDRVVLGEGHAPEPVLERVVCFAGEKRPIRVLSAQDEAACRRFLERHPVPGTAENRAVPSTRKQSDRVLPSKRQRSDRIRLHLMHGDGSRRRIVRAIDRDATAIMVINPPAPDSANYPRRLGASVPDENETFCYVGQHLEHLGVRVPRIYAFDKTEGLLLLEDLGSTRLADLKPPRSIGSKRGSSSGPSAVESTKDDPDSDARFEQAYREAVESLARIQKPGVEAFDGERTFNPQYDARFVLRYEIEYFQREMVERHAGLPSASTELRAEYEAIAERAGGSPERVLMHRDYQSRNLMVTREGIGVLDFQGARLGPPAYDLAALLLDPYQELGELEGRLFEHYLRITGRTDDFRESFPHVALARLMQTLGAFAYLGVTLGKAGYLEHAPRAVARISALAAPIYPRLTDLSSKLAERLAARTH
jgi:NDP-sugar pyrophosphorylase family protein/aminoglycoside/choline kinase family phosphotransferase